MAPPVQCLPILQSVGAEWPAAVGGVALCGGCHGQLVRQGRVCRYVLHVGPTQTLC